MFDIFAFHDPVAIAAAIISAVLIGLAKGGLSGVGILAVPVMALVISPVQAAGIVLPLLILSDMVSLYAWWGTWDRRTVLLLMPGAVAGIALGWATAAMVSDDAVRLIVGGVALWFFARWALQSAAARAARKAQNPAAATFWGGMTGYTSFVAHAGGPPFQVYVMPLGLDHRTYTGTNVLVFALVNLIKVPPYFLLGQFAATNLATSAALAPIAVAFTFVGAAIIRRMDTGLFYRLTYALLLLAGAKLCWDGIRGLMA